MSQYLELLKKGNVTPNFWCSEEYFEKAELKERQVLDSIIVSDEDWIMFPPLNFETGLLDLEPIVVWNKIWSDFPEWKPEIEGIQSKFLDYEYVYDPRSFLNMEGKDWGIFRKNCRKWPKRFGKELIYDWIDNLHFVTHKLGDVLISWLSSKPKDNTIHDSEILIEYMSCGENRKGLWSKEGELFGVNIFDFNYKFINFRYCICRSEPFLSEYMRLLFYTDPDIIQTEKLVNDGGVLDNFNLKKFKDKMNPIFIREVHSWFKKEDI